MPSSKQEELLLDWKSCHCHGLAITFQLDLEDLAIIAPISPDGKPYFQQDHANLVWSTCPD